MVMMELKKVLAIGGSDPSGGAGIQADMIALMECAAYPYTAITAVTAQNSTGVVAFEVLCSSIVRSQVDAIIADTGIDGIKTGMLGSSENIMEAARIIGERPDIKSVIDPVTRASDGRLLTSEAATAVLKKRLLPKAFMVTPNIHEAALLSGVSIKSEDDLLQAAAIIKDTGVGWVLIKGGHFSGPVSTDLLYDGTDEYYYEALRVERDNVRGTGCMMASAICAYLAHGFEAYDAVDRAKAYVLKKIKSAALLGKGSLQAVPLLISEAAKSDADAVPEDSVIRSDDLEDRAD
ncbi:MAG: bifunctional hydroxymethylpyrimidine kinase/phosphomethylpyrimidine kinase [Candidatus Aquicultor primus]|uniref:Bifunctional hydroxymethylpyrimidine kinase/phosphomethylpyrimidine kinase n=1 Tax=Candidatus Aquicultor primus TaxID=1797195 RepID=A0A1F2UHD2_9ACTN|nr:MAG: bifunctional hydroxymethylpyrimidine kinase/phosphomethylpyrimidine kinase [Candidatus Aquicultor primus]